MMNQCLYEQNAFAASEDMRMGSGVVVCPKPRRIGNLNPSVYNNNDHIRPSLRCYQYSHQPDISDSKAGMELLDIIRSKGSYSAQRCGTQVSSSPPFFTGSPPNRASNPLAQDLKFGVEKTMPYSQSPSTSSSRKGGGGCGRMKFGHKPALTRVVGFVL